MVKGEKSGCKEDGESHRRIERKRGKREEKRGREKEREVGR